MKKNPILIFLLCISILIFSNEMAAQAASGTCEIFYFTYTGSVGAGGTANIKGYLDDMGYTANRYANTRAYYVRRTMDEDKIFVIVAHGLPGRVYCKNGETTISAKAVKDDDNNYSLAAGFSQYGLLNMKLAYYGSCYSASTSGTYGNITTYTTSQMGAQCALGFTDSVASTQATYYESLLFYYLKNGSTVSNANSLCKTLTYNKYGTYGNVDTALISGNEDTTIN